MKLLLVIVTRPKGFCQSCDRYKETNESKLKSLVKGQTNVKIVELCASSTAEGRSLSGAEYVHPQMLQVYWKWWPSFFLFTEESWNDPQNDLKGFIMGGKLENGKMVEDASSTYSFLASDVFAWVNKQANELSLSNSLSYTTFTTDIRTNMKRRGSF